MAKAKRQVGVPSCRYWISVAGTSSTGKIQFDSLIAVAPDVQKIPEVLNALTEKIQKELSDKGRVYEELTIISFKLLNSAVSIPEPSIN